MLTAVLTAVCLFIADDFSQPNAADNYNTYEIIYASVRKLKK